MGNLGNRDRRAVLGGTALLLAVLLWTADNALAAYVTITAPANGATVSGVVSISAAIGSGTSWEDIYIDGKYYNSGPPLSSTWSSTSVANGTHSISAKAFSSSGTVLGSSAISVNVSNS